jgi:hypothetical protein
MNLIYYFAYGVRIEAHDHDGRALLRKALTDSFSDAGAATGYNGNFAFQSSFHSM